MSASRPIGCSVEIHPLAPAESVVASAPERLLVHVVLAGSFSLLCDLLARASGTPLFDAASSIEDPLVSRALAALHGHPARAWSVEELARAVGSSRAALARRFVAELGTPPMRALAEHRMWLADRLLVETDRSLAEIALEIGYESEFAFSRAFKRERGEAPGSLRRRIRSELRRRNDPIRSAA